MTLIACFSARGVPVLLGDVVTSTPLPGERRFLSPSAGEVVMAPMVEKAYGPSGLCQKIARISDNLCIAWTGSFFGARAVAEDLRARFGDAEVAFHEVNEFLGRLDYKEAKEVSLLGICNGAAGVEIFGTGGKKKDHPVCGPVYVAGTGISHFTHTLDTLQLTTAQFEAVHPAVVAGSLAAAFLSLDAQTLMSLQRHYGGGFEIVWFQGGKFRKLVDATYVFWRIRQDDKDRHKFHFDAKRSVLKICYSDSNMIIRRTDGVIFGAGPMRRTVTNTMFSIPPLIGGSTVAPSVVDELPNLNSAWTFHGFIIKLADNSIHVRSYAEFNKNSIEFHEEHGVIRAITSKALRERQTAIAEEVAKSLFQG